MTRRQGGTGRPFSPTAYAAAYRAKAARRARIKPRLGRKALWVTRRMSIPAIEREWRVLMLTGPDDRSLTGKLMGDPRFMRSALYAKQMEVA